MAVGCIGLSHDDFCKCTFEEFESICKAWSDMTEGQNRNAWERARTIAAIIIQPHVKKRITPKQLLPLPWDNEQKRRSSKTQKSNPDEARKRFEQLTRKIN